MKKKNLMLIFIFLVTIIITGFKASEESSSSNKTKYSTSELGKISKNFACVINTKGDAVVHKAPAALINQNTLSKEEYKENWHSKTLVLGY
jgi:hypothetical protein